MRKGIILEISDLYITLLTPDGEFMRARKLQQAYSIGEEIHFFPLETKAGRTFPLFNSFRVKALASFALALILVFAALLPFYPSSKVYAYMSIDVNPSIEIAMNQDLQVVTLRGYNEEGKSIIAGLDNWEKQDAVVVGEAILTEMKKQGYFKTNREIVIATVYAGQSKDSIDKRLSAQINGLKKAATATSLSVTVIRGSNEQRESAQKQGLTTGKYIDRQSQNNKDSLKTDNKQKETYQADRGETINDKSGGTPSKQPDSTHKQSVSVHPATEVPKQKDSNTEAGKLTQKDEKPFKDTKNNDQPKPSITVKPPVGAAVPGNKEPGNNKSPQAGKIPVDGKIPVEIKKPVDIHLPDDIKIPEEIKIEATIPQVIKIPEETTIPQLPGNLIREQGDVRLQIKIQTDELQLEQIIPGDLKRPYDGLLNKGNAREKSGK
ncbi:anti-sigma factor domain-containing protein [Bacillus sp. T33-2]|uniref:anti-sigma factor domain-containing protein n=1 Tax=Bacillus sp. T33-2 TaxID=2054168 RepID=UPI000C7806F9|nr:anti-sigma factor domain-containing protein [Bacillus sp. T33-2]PLR97514.1 hypothetical protein CVD19_08495 [Bacillus sp. T33-2]